MKADKEWALEYLISPLEKDDDGSALLWDAMARRTHFEDVLKIIGKAMAKRTVDPRVRRQTRRKLTFSLVVESLHALRERRDPAVSSSSIQQMLRSADDEVRAVAAGVVEQFVKEMSERPRDKGESPTAATAYELAAKPFLEQVWPQERSLVTQGVSRAFAKLPASSGDAFADAVDSINRFLVPFESLSMRDYGFEDYEGDVRSFRGIDKKSKASALLKLLDSTISASAHTVVPSDLSGALSRIRIVAPELEKSSVFQRLATAARR